MFCKNCGREIDDNSRFCPECGAKVNDDGIFQVRSNPSFSSTNRAKPEKQEGIALGLCALIFSIMGSCIGLVLAIIGLASYKTKCTGKTLSIAALIVFFIEVIIAIILVVIVYYIAGTQGLN